MSETQKLLSAIADQLTVASAELMVVKLRTMVAMLNKISHYSHTETALAAFGEEDTDA